MKKLCLFLLMICLIGIACEKKDDLEPEPSQENKKVCEFDNPLTDLLWLQEMVSDLEQNKTEYNCIYQVDYKNGIGFWISQCPEYLLGDKYKFINCEGKILCTWEDINMWREYNIDFDNMKPIWETQPDPRITFENLHEQSLHIVQEQIHGKWKVLRGFRWGANPYIISDNTFVNISTENNSVTITYEECDGSIAYLNGTSSYRWENKKVYHPDVQGKDTAEFYTADVMVFNKLYGTSIEMGWYFHSISKDVLMVVVDFTPTIPYYEHYLFLKIRD